MRDINSTELKHLNFEEDQLLPGDKYKLDSDHVFLADSMKQKNFKRVESDLLGRIIPQTRTLLAESRDIVTESFDSSTWLFSKQVGVYISQIK